ncbi:serine hydrolase [Aquimarina sp. 2201CG5-10]|uniref:serine hydrolase domain-containing protein n=1 Tax=Aquimarina callyspongiae TaxID=3098150 RepID=UPI002AB3936E|nr:serine hydrolase [Aquimarina sp. 2201CG5-10]MDY8138206.1 serine hydrolase [Aquimarina sp. 2201CG5-10]
MKHQSYLLFTFLIVALSCKKPVKNTSNTINKPVPEKVSEDSGIYSVLVSKDDQIVFEEYYNSKKSDDLCNVQSLTKGIMSILIGIAIDQKIIENENEPIEKYFPEEFKNLKDERKKQITIKHLLNQTSGLSWKGFPEHQNWINSENPITFVLQKKLEYTPGEKYNYNTAATHLLSAIISRATEKTTLEFANEYLFDTLTIDKIDWKKRNDGYYAGGGLGLEMKSIDLMKIGQLLENQGVYDDKRLISKEWVNQLFDTAQKLPTRWGLQNSTHGFCWYTSELKGDTINYGMGYGGQFIIIVPNKDLVIVATHNHDTPKGIEQQIKFLNKKLPQLIEKFGN